MKCNFLLFCCYLLFCPLLPPGCQRLLFSVAGGKFDGMEMNLSALALRPEARLVFQGYSFLTRAWGAKVVGYGGRALSHKNWPDSWCHFGKINYKNCFSARKNDTFSFFCCENYIFFLFSKKRQTRIGVIKNENKKKTVERSKNIKKSKIKQERKDRWTLRF